MPIKYQCGTYFSYWYSKISKPCAWNIPFMLTIPFLFPWISEYYAIFEGFSATGLIQSNKVWKRKWKYEIKFLILSLKWLHILISTGHKKAVHICINYSDIVLLCIFFMWFWDKVVWKGGRRAIREQKNKENTHTLIRDGVKFVLIVHQSFFTPYLRHSLTERFDLLSNAYDYMNAVTFHFFNIFIMLFRIYHVCVCVLLLSCPLRL